MTSLTLEQRKKVDLLKERLVPAAEQFLEDARVVEIKKSDFGDKQIRNLLEIANETASPAVVLNFIRYQIGRDPKNRAWGRVEGDRSLGDRLIGELDERDGIIAETLATLGLEGERQQLAKMELIRQYLGFASRYLKYLDLRRR